MEIYLIEMYVASLNSLLLKFLGQSMNLSRKSLVKIKLKGFCFSFEHLDTKIIAFSKKIYLLLLMMN